MILLHVLLLVLVLVPKVVGRLVDSKPVKRLLYERQIS